MKLTAQAFAGQNADIVIAEADHSGIRLRLTAFSEEGVRSYRVMFKGEVVYEGDDPHVAAEKFNHLHDS